MAKTKLTVLILGFTFTLVFAIGSGVSAAAEFSDEVTALPFPPDARELEFDASFEDVSYKTRSPLKSLIAFYLKEMGKRGWKHDESAADIDDDSADLLFKHGEAKVELDLSQWSKEVHVSIDCTGLKFTDTDDPSKLAAAGIPVSRSALFLQKQIPLPSGVKDIQYEATGCTIKSSMKLKAAFDYYNKLLKGKGFRESRRPIIKDTRRYTKFKKGSIELSVNVFTHDVGSRIVLGYEDSRKENPIPPLPAVSSLSLDNTGTGNKSATTEKPAAPSTKPPINFTNNKGSVTVNFGDKKYTLANAASYQTKDSGSEIAILFSAKPIPWKKLQTTIATKDDFSFSDLYDFNFPDHLVLHLTKTPYFSLSISGVGIGRSVEKPTNKMKVEAGRVRGTFKMSPEEVLDKPLSFTATIDAAIITPNTRTAAPDASVKRTESPADSAETAAISADSPISMPEGAENVSQKGSKFRTTRKAVVDKSLSEVIAFYFEELTTNGWGTFDVQDEGSTLIIKDDTKELTVSLKRQGEKTAIEIVTRNTKLAKQQGVLPEPGKGRLILANAHNVDVLFTIGKTEYPLKAGHGAKDFKQALNYSIPPGTYTVVIKIPGKQPQTKHIKLTKDSTWAIIVLPTGGYMPMQLY